jgi:hypothetical protein
VVSVTPCIICKGAGENFVSNAVSNAEKSEPPMANLSGIKLLLFGEIWTMESDGELEKWA